MPGLHRAMSKSSNPFLDSFSIQAARFHLFPYRRPVRLLCFNNLCASRNRGTAAIERVRAALKALEQKETSVETAFRLPDRWSRRLFTALCRRHGLTPYRYPRQRYSTVVLRAPVSFVNKTLWPEFLEIKSALDDYLNEATERIIREEVFRVSEEAEERVS
jgi:hypothetical protein